MKEETGPSPADHPEKPEKETDEGQKPSFFVSLLKSRMFWFNSFFFVVACLLFFQSEWSVLYKDIKTYTSENLPSFKEKVKEEVLTMIPKKGAAGREEKHVKTSAGSMGKEKKKERKIKYWQAPMDPNYIRSEPGKSPMGMDLIPVYEDQAGDDDTGGIRIDAATVQNIGVKTEIAKRRSLKREIRTVGGIDYNEKAVFHIHTKFEGWVEKLYVDFTGKEVKKDELLMEIYSPDLVSTQEEYLQALSFQEELKKSTFSDIVEGANSVVEATKRRLMLWDIPKHQIDELFQNKKIFKAMHIHSPQRGFVVEKNIQEGMFVKPGMNLYTIADISTVWVHADVYEYELPWIKMGQRAEMELSYFPGKVFRGKVTFIYPFLDQKTRTVKVRIEFPNPRWKLKPDMYANVTLKSAMGKNAVTVPEEAVIHSGKRNVVIVARENGKFESRDVVLGVNAEGYYQIIKGISPGEKIVTSSQFLIDSESKLQEAIQKMLKEKEKPGMSMSPPMEHGKH